MRVKTVQHAGVRRVVRWTVVNGIAMAREREDMTRKSGLSRLAEHRGRRWIFAAGPCVLQI